MSNLPMSLRRTESEAKYQDAKKFGDTTPLHRVQPLLQFDHWILINNDYPYDMCFKTHHMLIPRRQFAKRHEMNLNELEELDLIIWPYIEEHYHLMFENTTSRRSVNGLYHLHVAEYYSSREEMQAANAPSFDVVKKYFEQAAGVYKPKKIDVVIR